MHKVSKKSVGLSPGTLVYTGHKKKGPIKIRVIDYTLNSVHDTYISKIEDLKKYVDRKSVSWINVIGVHHTGMIEKIGNVFNLHPLMMEDIVNVHSRPKLDVEDGLLFTQMQMIYYDAHKKLIFEQLSMILGNNFVITFQEDDFDVFDPIRDRIKKDNWRIRKLDNDYLAYAIVDAIVDNYFSIMDETGNLLDRIDTQVIKKPSQKSLFDIHKLKRDLVILRKNIWPVREIIDKMKKTDTIIQDSTKRYIDDLYDHTIQIIESIETYREMAASIVDTYHSSIGNRMNEIMKVLTVISTVFIPLTFITGVYGMNFLYMPELAWKYGYFIIWTIMLGIAGWLFYSFRKRKWL